MREDDKAEATAMGLNPRTAVWQAYRKSILRRTAFVDGDIAAMWGLSGGLLSSEGVPWLATTKAVERMPVAFIKETRREVAEMLRIRVVLRNVVLARYERAVGLLRLVGFTVGEPEPFGPQGVLFRSFFLRK